LYKKGTFHHKKGHFSSQKRALSITKKGTFSPLKKLGGGGICPPLPTPLLAAVNNIVNIENDSQGGQE
jgi:hypothetical protein